MKRYFSQRVCVLAALLSLPATALLSWLVMRVLYMRTPEYTEFVTGYTTWTAYYKSGDMTLAYLVIFGTLGFFLFFASMLTLLARKMSWLKGSFETAQEDAAQEAENAARSWEAAQKGSAARPDKRTAPRFQTGYRPGFAESYEKIAQFCYLLIFSEFSLAALYGAIVMAAGIVTQGNALFHILQVLLLIIVGIFAYFYLTGGKVSGTAAARCRKDTGKANAPESAAVWSARMNRALLWSQAFLPLCFAEIFCYRYRYQGELLIQYSSVKTRVLSLCFTAAVIFLNLFQLRKEKRAGRPLIFLGSFLSLAVFASYSLPSGTISGTPLEMYHYGELSAPLHQLLNYGVVPYLDTMPIHGVCDYFQAAVWYLFFDGTYASFEPAMILGCVVIAVITAAIYYYFVENKLAGILCILLFSLFGDKYYYVRWAFALPFILIVFSRKVRQDFPRLLWCWTFISILSIAWNSSIGGACALAALPMVLWEGFHEGGLKIFLRLREREVRKKLLPWYLPLLVLGVCFIPMFLAILRYIVENSAAILETTGDILLEELTSAYVWYATFGFALSLLAALVFLAGKRGAERKLAVYAVLFLLLFNLIIVRYTFVRTQFGERGIIVTTICSLFLVLTVLLPSLERRFSRCTLALLLLLFVCTAVSKGANLLTLPEKIFAVDEISEDYVYAAAEETGIEGLGDIFITQEQKDELVNLDTLANELCADLKFVDMTNQLSHYNILDKQNLLPFSSTYNTNNKVMQTRAIEVLKEVQPEIIVVAPAWEHDSGSLSTRNYYLYQYLARHYTPCRYENIIFLTNSDDVRARFEAAYEELGQLMHIEDLKGLPLCWGNAYLQEEETAALAADWSLIDTNAQKRGEDEWLLSAEENYFLYSFAENQSGGELPFLRITVEDLGMDSDGIETEAAADTEAKQEENEAAEDFHFQCAVYFMEEGESVKEAHRFLFDGGEGSFLIPLTTSLYWSYSGDIQSMMIDFLGAGLEGREVTIRAEFETWKDAELYE